MNPVIASYTHIGNRRENEDSHGFATVSQNKLYAIVCDGLGGHGGGKTASQTAVNVLSQCGNDEAFPAPEQVRRWLVEANQAVLARRDGPNRMKTTVVFLCIRDNQAIWAHIGDSRLYHFHNRRFAEVTLDHSVTQIAVLQGDITRAQMPQHPDRSRLIRAMGNEEFEPTIHAPVQLEPGEHAFLLCTDGFWETLIEDEIGLDLLKAATPQQWIDGLRIRGEKRREGMQSIDNNTAVALFVTI